MTERDRASRPAGRPASSHEPPLIHRRSAFSSFFVITIPPSARRSVEALLSRAALRCAWPPTVATAMAVACGGSSVVSFLHRFTCALPARTSDVHRHWLTRVHTRKRAIGFRVFVDENYEKREHADDGRIDRRKVLERGIFGMWADGGSCRNWYDKRLFVYVIMDGLVSFLRDDERRKKACSPVSCLLSLVSCLLSPVSCLLSPPPPVFFVDIYY